MDLGPVFGIANVVVPSGGPKVIPTPVNFANAASILLDGSQIVTQGKIEYLQGVYIDNSANVDPLSLTMSTTGQKIICPANSQGYFSIMCPNPPQITVATTQQNLTITLMFYNVPIQAAVWKTV